jgi:hypothetical protein
MTFDQSLCTTFLAPIGQTGSITAARARAEGNNARTIDIAIIHNQSTGKIENVSQVINYNLKIVQGGLRTLNLGAIFEKYEHVFSSSGPAERSAKR